MACYIDEKVVGSKKVDNYILQPVEGMLSHQLEQNRIDGEKTIIQVFKIDFWPNYNSNPFLLEPQRSSAKGAWQVWICSARGLRCWCPHQLWRGPGVKNNMLSCLMSKCLFKHAQKGSVTVAFTQGREKDAKITIYKKTEDTYVSIKHCFLICWFCWFLVYFIIWFLVGFCCMYQNRLIWWSLHMLHDLMTCWFHNLI